MNNEKKITPFPLRLPTELRKELEQTAKENSRSLNAEILHILLGHSDIEQQIIDALDNGDSKATSVIRSTMAEMLDDLLLERGLVAKDSPNT